MQNYYVQFRIFYQYVHKYTILLKYVKIYKLIWTAGGSRLQMTLEARFVLIRNVSNKLSQPTTQVGNANLACSQNRAQHANTNENIL